MSIVQVAFVNPLLNELCMYVWQQIFVRTRVTRIVSGEQFIPIQKFIYVYSVSVPCRVVV